MTQYSIFDIGLSYDELSYSNAEHSFSVHFDQIENNIFRVILTGFLNFEANLYYVGIIENILLKFKRFNPSIKVHFIEHASNLTGFSFDAKPYTEKKILAWKNLGSIKIVGTNHLYRTYLEMIQKVVPQNTIEFNQDEREALASVKFPEFKESDSSTVAGRLEKPKIEAQIQSETLNKSYEKVQQKEWILTTPDKHFTGDFSIIENQVIFANAAGYLQNSDIVKFLDFNDKLRQFFELDDREYSQIIDVSRIHGMSNSVKRILKSLLLRHGSKLKKLVLVKPPASISNTLNILNTLFPDKLSYCYSAGSIMEAYNILGIKAHGSGVESIKEELKEEILIEKEEKIEILTEEVSGIKSLHQERIHQLEEELQKLTDKQDVSSAVNLPNDDPYHNLFEAIFKLQQLFRANEASPNSGEWRKQIDYLREIINLSDDGIMVVTNGTIEYVNQKVLSCTGQSSEELLGSKLDNILDTDDLVRINRMIQRIQSTGPIYEHFDARIFNGKKRIDVKIRLSTIIYNNEMAALLFIKRPETVPAAIGSKAGALSGDERSQLAMLEEKLYDAEQFKNSLLANLSHEIRTPMTAIVGLAEFLTNPIDQQATDEYVKLIKLNANNLLALINDLIEISRLESCVVKLEKEVFNTHDLLEDLYEDFATVQEISELTHIEFELKNKVRLEPRINSDYDRIRQILSQLLRNSFKFTESGKIEFGISGVDDKSIEFYVKDTGIGIAKDKQNEIFDLFKQMNDGYAKEFAGLGLGLSIVKQLLVLFEGKMTIESDSNVGSLFKFIIPLEYAEAQESKEVKLHSGISGDKAENDEKVNILIVEDIEPSYILLYSMLRKTGANIIWARNGQEAITICTEQQIDLVLMDIRMPLVNGLEATQKIKTFKPKLPVIAQTAYTQEEDRTRIFNSGCDDYISKPIEMDILYDKLNRFLEIDLQASFQN
jgi:PAS domain S-box-containing protein